MTCCSPFCYLPFPLSPSRSFLFPRIFSGGSVFLPFADEGISVHAFPQAALTAPTRYPFARLAHLLRPLALCAP